MRVCKVAVIALCLIGVPAIQGCVGVAATGSVAGGMAAHDRRTPGKYIDDEIIELKVLLAINQDGRMASQTHVNVTSVNGLVLLTGEAPGESLRKRITEIARNVPAVRSVQNEVALQAPSTLVSRTSDTLVTGKVKLALLQDEGLGATRVKVVTERGNVYLMGLLRQVEANRATEIARRIPGVQRVVVVVEYIR